MKVFWTKRGFVGLGLGLGILRLQMCACQRTDIYIYIVVYKVLSIYRFLPGFREIAVFEKSNRFFILFCTGVT